MKTMTDQSSQVLHRNSNYDFKFEPSQDGSGAYVDTRALHKTMESFATTLKLGAKENNESITNHNEDRSPKKFQQSSAFMDERVELSEEDLELLL